jgi:alcohol dehydrogenase
MISTYTQLCPVVFGAGAVNQIGEKAKEFKVKRVFCICDKGVKDTGIVGEIINSLNKEQIESSLFSDVIADAPDSMVNEAGKLANSFEADLVIGIGGGSSLDTAKAVTVLLDNPLPISNYYASAGGSFKAFTPLILIPTSSGTGSEVTLVSVIHDHITDAKEGVFRSADLAIVDPELTLSVPPHVTAATGMDALSHAIESYTTNIENPKADILSLAAIELIVNNLELAYKDGTNIEARSALAFASNIAGMAFNDSSVHFGHCAAHEFGIKYHIPHGAGCALSLPEVIRFSSDVQPEKVKKIAKALGLKNTENISALEAGEQAANKLRELMKIVGIKSLKELGISREDAVACAGGAVNKNWFVICSPKIVDVNIMGRLIGEMYDNYQ